MTLIRIVGLERHDFFGRRGLETSVEFFVVGSMQMNMPRRGWMFEGLAYCCFVVMLRFLRLLHLDMESSLRKQIMPLLTDLSTH